MSVHIYRVVRNATYCQKIDATAKRILILTVDHESHRYVEWVSMQCSSLPYCRSWLKKPVSNSTVDRELELLRMTVIQFSYFEVTMNYDELAIICQNFLCQEVDEVPIVLKDSNTTLNLVRFRVFCGLQSPTFWAIKMFHMRLHVRPKVHFARGQEKTPSCQQSLLEKLSTEFSVYMTRVVSTATSMFSHTFIAMI